uniref:Uncharacterized protein n=1 Tax=Plectus sambesii TaxID=2011161 RepID=A0A914VQM1_9BILA
MTLFITPKEQSVAASQLLTAAVRRRELFGYHPSASRSAAVNSYPHRPHCAPINDSNCSACNPAVAADESSSRLEGAQQRAS